MAERGGRLGPTPERFEIFARESIAGVEFESALEMGDGFLPFAELG